MPKRKKHSDIEILKQSKLIRLDDHQVLARFQGLLEEGFSIEPWLRGQADPREIRKLLKELRAFRAQRSHPLLAGQTRMARAGRRGAIRAKNYPTVFAQIYLGKLRRTA